MERIGIDVGGTTIKGARFSEAGEVLKEIRLDTPAKEGREAIFSALFSAVDGLLSPETAFLGVSSAGTIDPDRGVCVYATDNLVGWTGAPVKETLERRYGLPCRVDNDAVCALKGELVGDENARDVTMLTFGTGVGGASLAAGRILRGKDFSAARWGHVPLFAEGRRCNCGRRGCAESYLSAKAAAACAFRAGLGSVPELFARFEEGDERAEHALIPFRRALNRLLSLVKTALSPRKILLGGGMTQSQKAFLGLIDDDSEIAFARRGMLAGAYGAAFGGTIGEDVP